MYYVLQHGQLSTSLVQKSQTVFEQPVSLTSTNSRVFHSSSIQLFERLPNEIESAANLKQEPRFWNNGKLWKQRGCQNGGGH